MHVIDYVLSVVIQSDLMLNNELDHTNPKCEETAYNVLYCYVLCTVL